MYHLLQREYKTNPSGSCAGVNIQTNAPYEQMIYIREIKLTEFIIKLIKYDNAILNSRTFNIKNIDELIIDVRLPVNATLNRQLKNNETVIPTCLMKKKNKNNVKTIGKILAQLAENDESIDYSIDSIPLDFANQSKYSKCNHDLEQLFIENRVRTLYIYKINNPLLRQSKNKP
ncbi:hypothetical protein [Spiroplasma endosymbiont of Polydrusus formosus]|uniref:hypothetical protein n=1 Tax=Spiroplasma endosymbiont of Polydrusus formosus TaxID=3139326 RepID=UPI0035B4FBDE